MPSFNNSKRSLKDKQKDRDYPSLEPHIEKVLVVVKAIPRPSIKHREIVCTAGIAEKGKWIRLYPIEFRYMSFFKRFKKYQWVSLKVEKNTKDNRIDSYRPDLKTIKLLGKPLLAGKWAERKKIVLPTVSPDLETIKSKYESEKVSLGIFKPKKIVDFVIESDDKDWSSKHRQVLSQLVLFGTQPKRLERIPYKFSYKFVCNNTACGGHTAQIIDWEIYELYRGIKNNYPYSMDIILEKVKQKWLKEMWGQSRDSYLIVGSIYPFSSFVVLGVFWPPK